MTEPIGYGRPPRATRFKKGLSGNPRGRRNTSGSIDALDILDGPLTVTAGSRRRKIDPFEVTIENLFKAAIKGDMRAARRIIEFCVTAGMFKTPRDEHQFVRIVPREWEFGVWLEMRRLFGEPPWDGPLDGLLPEGRRLPPWSERR